MAKSNIRIKKICEWCGQEFVAQKVTTKYCSHRCANLAYKQAIRAKRIQQEEQRIQIVKTEKPLMDIKDKEYLSIAQAATLLGLSLQAVYKMIYTGHLAAYKLSSRLSFVRQSDIEEMLKRNPYKKRQPKDTLPITDFYTTHTRNDNLKTLFLSQTSILPMRLKRNSVSKIPGYFISLRNIIFHEPFTVEKPIGAKSILMTTLQRKLPILKSGNGTARKTCRRSSV